MAEIEASGWPWPWPGDDKGGEDKTPGGGKKGKNEPIEERMDRLAGKVVEFERELIRAGADPEYLFNPHFSYNPYPTERVEKALPFLDIPLYLSAYAPRSFPTNITVTHPPYLKSVSKLVETTPDYVLAGYFNTRLALTYASALGPKVGLRQETRRLEEVLKGLKKGTEENRRDVCLAWVDDVVGYIVGREFVNTAFSPEAKADGEHIITCAYDDNVCDWTDGYLFSDRQRFLR
jgi:endothelin-converting enzyme